MDIKLTYMNLALDQARLGLGRTSPNPAVGAVIVNQGEVVGKGFHPQAGQPHAEIFALREAGSRAAGSDVYVTLEPCSHFGKTPPCADALINAGVKRVFIGTVDPNPQVAGRGISKLKDAGILVETDILGQECRRLIAPFAKHILTGLPFTIYKSAQTLDGATATCSGDSRWVSSDQSRQLVHQLRDRVEAIMVGINTVINDDPLLTTRLEEGSGRDPLRVVIDGQLRMPLTSKMLNMQSSAGTLIATASQDMDKRQQLEQLGAEIFYAPDSANDKVDLHSVWRELGRRNVQRLLLEGGATLATAALEAGLIDQLMLFIAPKMIGGQPCHGIFSGPGQSKMTDALTLSDLSYCQVGLDLLITGDLHSCLPD